MRVYTLTEEELTSLAIDAAFVSGTLAGMKHQASVPAARIRDKLIELRGVPLEEDLGIRRRRSK